MGAVPGKRRGDDGRAEAPAASDVAAAAFAADAHVQLALQDGGVLQLDRALPFLIVHRRRPNDAGTALLPATEASWLLVGGTAAAEAEARAILEALAAAAQPRFGALLVVELWSDPAEPAAFRIRGPAREAASTVQALADALADVPLPAAAAVRMEPAADRHPPGLEPLVDVGTAWRSGILLLGLAVPPVYRSPEGDVFPVYFRRFRAALSRALRVAVADFARVQTSAGVESYRALGPRRVGDVVWQADGELAAIERLFDFLLLVSPMDAAAAYDRFAAAGFDCVPEFHYRLLPFDPDLLKRRLYAVPLEDVEDPALAQLLREKREELDRQVSLLLVRGTPAFRLGTQQLYGAPDPALLEAARALLTLAPADAAPLAEPVSALAFAEHAAAEVEAYRVQLPGLAVDIQIRPDVTGLMVSSGRLLIGERLALAPGRVDALLHHEIGTHVLTYVNGAAQPLQQLRHGLAGYDELQEALAVLAEYLVGGLSAARLRTLGARVLAAEAVVDGAGFLETFRLLSAEHGFAPAAAFDIAERAHQGGGTTRDLIYLRGLLALLESLGAGAVLEPLYIGKLAAGHTELVRELRERGVLREPVLRPRFLERPAVQARLAAVRAGGGVQLLLQEAA